MPSRKLEDLHPDLQPVCREFLRRCAAVGLDILVTCTYRTAAEQDQLYSQGRNGHPGPRVTNARGGQSAHNVTTLDGQPSSRAFDIVPMVAGKPMWSDKHPAWQQAGQIGMALGLNWYGRADAPFREFPHFELPLQRAVPQ